MLGHKSYTICTPSCYICRLVIMTAVCKHLNKILNVNIMIKYLNAESRVAIWSMKFQHVYKFKLLTILYVISSIMISLGGMYIAVTNLILYHFCIFYVWNWAALLLHVNVNPYPTAFPYGNGMVLHFYQQQESSTTKTVHRVINKGLKTYV